MFRKLTLVAIVTLSSTLAASAQSGSRVIIEQPGSGGRQEGMVRVQVSINMFLPGPTGEGEDAAKLRDRGRRLVYEMAAKECDLLRDVIAKDCRLENITANVNRQRHGNQQEGYQVGGNMSLQITLK
jgi:hypothetical protein